MEWLTEEQKEAWHSLKKEVLNLSNEDMFIVKGLDAKSRTREIFLDYKFDSKKFMCIKHMFYIKYSYMQDYRDYFMDIRFDKRVCWLDLIICENDLYYEDEIGLTMSELKQFSRYDVMEWHVEVYMPELYSELKNIKTDFYTVMKNDKDYCTHIVPFGYPVSLRAQDSEFYQYGRTDKYLIVGAVVHGCKAPIRFVK